MKCNWLAVLAILIFGIFASEKTVIGAETSLPLPSPAIHMYGYGDSSDDTTKALWDSVLSVATIIEGSTEKADFVKELRAKGKIFAYHVVNTFSASATAEDVANAWAVPFENTLNGQLPGGFDAVCIDELHGAADGSSDSVRVVNALQLLRQRYPNKYIMAAGVWQLGLSGDSRYVGGASYDNQLRAVRDYCDLFFLENYVTESNVQIDFFKMMATNVNRRVPGLLAKTIFGLAISQSNPFAYDNSPYINFNEYLDGQFHTIRNDALMKGMPGIGFWVFYRARPETLLHCVELCKHYYYQNLKTYYGEGRYDNILIQDPGFDAGNAVAWRTSTAAAFTPYADLPGTIPPQHYSIANHGTSCLQTTRGPIASRIRQIATVSPGAWYRLSGYVTSNSLTYGATLGVFDYRGEAFFHVNETFPLTCSYYLPTKWKRISLRFKVPADTNKIVIYFSDEPSEQNSVVYWDFFELEKDYIDGPIPSASW
jgi:hypothetical protein